MNYSTYEYRLPSNIRKITCYVLQGVKIFAGVRRARSGELIPTGVGRLCNWTPDKNGPEADEYPSFGAYQRSLTLVCEEGNPGVVTWIPDKNTPDTVYYQVISSMRFNGLSGNH